MNEMIPDNIPVNTGTDQSVRNLLQIPEDGIIPGGKITITKDTLVAVDAKGIIPALIQQYFSDEPISLSDAVANPAGAGPVIITGEATFSLSADAVPLVLTLDIADGNVQLLFNFTMIGEEPPEQPWTFSDSFPDLPTVTDTNKPDAKSFSPLDRLDMRNAAFLLSSRAQHIDGQDLIAGLNFRADLIPGTILSVFQTLLGVGDLKLQGTIYVPAPSVITPPLKSGQYPWDAQAPVPGINLKASLGVAPFTLGSMRFAAEYFRIYSAVTEEWFGANSTFVTTVGYTGNFAIPSADAEIGVGVLTPPGSAAAQLIVNFEHSPLGNFAQLIDITGMNNLLSVFPDAIQKGNLGGLGIQQASVTIGFEKGLTVKAASVSVGMPQLNWDVWSGHFQVASITADITVQSPFTAADRSFDILVEGQLLIEKVPVRVAARKSTSFEVMASLPSGFNVPLSQLMQTYAPGIPPVSDLAIDALELIVSPGNYYSIMLLMAQQPKPWIIPLGLTELQFSNVGLFLLKPANGDLSGSFSGTATIAGVSLAAQYQIPGEVQIRGDFPSVTLSEIVSFFIQRKVDAPAGFDLTFTDSFILLQKKGSIYKLELGTRIENIGSLAFVLQKGTNGWGVAAGLQIKLDQLGNLSGGVSDSVQAFTSWFPFQTFTLAISTLQDQSFSFPGFNEFKEPSLGKDKIKLPAMAKGIQPGFFLYTSTVFTRKNKILGALIDLLKIPEGTQLDAFVAYLTQKKQFQLGVSVSTFLTPVDDVQQRTCSGALGYENTCLTGTIMVMAGGSDGFAFSLAASLKTLLDNNQLDFDVILKVVANGAFVSGSMKAQKPVNFGHLQLGGLALELGISFEGLPSFGFFAQLMVEGLFDSSLAVMVNSTNPSESMIAGSISDITLADIVAKLVGDISEDIPKPLMDALEGVAVKGSKYGAFEVPKDKAPSFATALNDFEGENIESVFTTVGKQPAFPNSSDGLMIFNDSDNGKWFLTEQAGTGTSSTVTHWQVAQQNNGALKVSKEAQLYFVPAPSGVSIGTFFYPQGMKISGCLQFLFFKVEADIEIEVDKGFKVDVEMDKISFISDNFFSIAAERGDGGPQVSIATYTQPNAPEKFRKPHFFINGKMTMLGAGQGIFVDINESGAEFEVSGSSIGGIFQGVLKGGFTAEKVNVGGSISIGIGSIDLGKLGKWDINTGVYAAANIYADIAGGSFGAQFTAGFELGGDKHSLGVIDLDVHVGKFSELPAKCFEAVKEMLVKLFTDPKYWAQMAAKVLGWVEDKVRSVLSGVFGLSSQQVDTIINAINAFCPIVTAVGILAE